MKIYMVAENWVDDCEPGYRISVWMLTCENSGDGSQHYECNECH